jgi:CO dehydrogenase maturation factor
LKIAISGKGGVGKTTITGALAHLFAKNGYKVLAIDADPDANLASALGIKKEVLKDIVPLSAMNDLIEERTGAKPGFSGGYFKLNPKVDDIPDKYCIETDGIKLLVMGTIDVGGSGCVCPENTLIRNLIRHLLVDRNEVVIMDMEAGIEHLGRSTADAVDALIVVVEPGLRSIQTAESINKLASDIGVKNIFIILNKVKDIEEVEMIRQNLNTPGLSNIKFLGFLKESGKIRKADLTGRTFFDADEDFMNNLDELRKKIEGLL